MANMFITVEGVEGSGKTTQMRKLYDFLVAKGYDVVLTREPGGCPIANQIRAILLHADNASMVEKTELLLYAAARSQHIAEVILPALKDGKVVLCDRFTDSTLAYQGARGISREEMDSLNNYATGGLKPDLTILFDLPVDIGLQRSFDRLNGSKEESRFEMEMVSFHKKVRDNFFNLQREEPQRIRTINANQSVERVTADLVDLVTGFIKKQMIL